METTTNETESDLQWEEFTNNREAEKKRKKNRKIKRRIIRFLCFLILFISLYIWFGHTWGKMKVVVDGKPTGVMNLQCQYELCRNHKCNAIKLGSSTYFLENSLAYGMYRYTCDIPVNGTTIQPVIIIFNTREGRHINANIVMDVYQVGNQYDAKITVVADGYDVTESFSDIEHNEIYIQFGP